jgi:hypothetical protein
VIEVVHGRADDILDLPGNTGGRVTLHPIHLRRLLATVREVVSYQITQRPREIDIQVMLTTPDPGLPSRMPSASWPSCALTVWPTFPYECTQSRRLRAHPVPASSS